MTPNGDFDGGFKVATPDFAASAPNAKPAFVFVKGPSEESNTVAALVTTAVAVAAGVALAATPVPADAAENSTDAETPAPVRAESEAAYVLDPTAGVVGGKPTFTPPSDNPLDETALQAPENDDVQLNEPRPIEVLELDIGAVTTPVVTSVTTPTVALPAVTTATKLPNDFDLSSLSDLFGRNADKAEASAADEPSEAMAVAKLLAGRFGVKMEAMRASLEDRMDAFKFDALTTEGPVDEAPLDPFLDAIDPMWAAQVVEMAELAGLLSSDAMPTLPSDTDFALPPYLQDTPDGFVV